MSAISTRGGFTNDYLCYRSCDRRSYIYYYKHRKPNCDSFGSGCYDPRFIGADGVVFYFHEKSGGHFALVSDPNLHINAHFIGHRPEGRTRDFTWIQSLGVLFNSHSLSLEATKAAQWDDEVDHLNFSYDGKQILLPIGPLATWTSPEKIVKIERISSKNSFVVSIDGFVGIAVNVVPVTKEDDKTYQPDFENPAKPGVAMLVLGGEDKYRTTSLLAPDCKACVFSSNEGREQETSMSVEYNVLDCTGKFPGENGIAYKTL
ncbi:late embryogenesis abundant (LEA) protein-like protein [Actinidia rufa]|uniref:Late embryogenesis abundant (LEA) protein-like protein n=1 Tax=Actinidia rufa TaxID=165716 RepID=A0A7J0GP27_9ERIC|nr:late embryogenesis abundant (LEA) protein-like protein [Actinidia rufa]